MRFLHQMKTTVEKLKISHFTYAFLLLIIAILGYWQIAFLKYSVTHDMINCWIPWRYHISECFRNHVFPFWNPYQQLGYPIHADLQGPTWYLESILLSMTTGQTNYTLHFLFIFYVFLAGVGMYFLCLAFHKNRTVAFLTGICYMLGGFFVAHVQHFYAIIGAAWLPFIILNYYKMYIEKRFLYALYAAVFMFFNLTGGNHTFSIILVYLFISFFVFFTISAIREKNKKDIVRYVQLNALFILATVLMASVVLVAFYQTASYIERLSGMSYKAASVCPLSPQSLLSLLLPFSTVNSIDFYNTDQSMCNIYVGSIMFIFIVLALMSKKQPFEKMLFVFAFVCLLASFGAYTPMHKFLFNFFPLMNRFRFPSYFSLFSVIIFLVLGSKQMAMLASEKQENYKKIFLTTVFTLAIIVTLVIIALTRKQGSAFFFLKKYDTIFDFIKSASFFQNIVLQGAIQLLFLGIFIATIISPLKKHWLKIMGILIVVDMFIATQLNIAYVGFSSSSPKELHDYIITLPHNFQVPASNNISENTEQLGQKHGLYRNTSIFHKRVSADVFNSYAFKNYVLLSDSLPLLFKAMQKNPLLYFSDFIYPENEVDKLDSAKITHSTILLGEDNYRKLVNEIEQNKTDSATTITITSYTPNAVSLKATSAKQQLLTFLQSYYPGWKATIDGKPSEIYLSNYLTISILFPKGEHEVMFTYNNSAIITAAAISYTSFIVLLLLFSYTWIIKDKNYWSSAVIWLILIGSLLYYFI